METEWRAHCNYGPALSIKHTMIAYLPAPPRLMGGNGGSKWWRIDSPCWRHTLDISSSSSTALPSTTLSTIWVMVPEPLDTGSFNDASTRISAGWPLVHSVTDRRWDDWPPTARLLPTVLVLPPGVTPFLSFVSSASFSAESFIRMSWWPTRQYNYRYQYRLMAQHK